MVHRLSVEQSFRDNYFDDKFQEIIMNLLLRDILIMLLRYKNRMDSNRFDILSNLLILYGNLHLRIWSHPRAQLRLSRVFQLLNQLITQHMRDRHQLCCFVTRISHHHPLVSCADVLVGLSDMHGISDFIWLPVETNNHSRLLVVKPFLYIIVANLLYRLSHDRLVTPREFRWDLPKNHHQTVLANCLTRHLGIRINDQTSVQDRVRDIVTQFIRMTLRHRLRGKQEPLITILFASVHRSAAHLNFSLSPFFFFIESMYWRITSPCLSRGFEQLVYHSRSTGIIWSRSVCTRNTPHPWSTLSDNLSEGSIENKLN